MKENYTKGLRKVIQIYESRIKDHLDGIVLKRSWPGEIRNVSVLVAIGISSTGYRKILGVAEGATAK